MYRLSPPSVNAVKVFDDCVALIIDESNRSMYKNAKPYINQKYKLYNHLADTNSFNNALDINFQTSKPLSTDDMKYLYNNILIRRSDMRNFRESIRNSAPNNLCPFCGEGIVMEIDHFLPESKFPTLSINPINLVPICRDCNKTKTDYRPDMSIKRFSLMHPYFDSAIEVNWMKAELYKVGFSGTSITFTIDSTMLDELSLGRVQAHVNKLKLFDMYSLKSAQLIEDTGRLLQQFGTDNSLYELKRIVNKLSLQVSEGITNSWKRATYDAIAKADWYLSQYANSEEVSENYDL